MGTEGCDCRLILMVSIYMINANPLGLDSMEQNSTEKNRQSKSVGGGG